ncbi:MAG: CDP-diacylglycerol--glycerol-3-phosphate 3-phosphatidyltransferase [bacterium]|nr:CDP-diacylglycerol--glycerol-3-phosphate 3-phosphatidyltransferase [bacterium]
MNRITKEFFNIPNLLTILRVVLLPVIILLVYENTFLTRNIAFWLYFFAGCTDFFDGYIARKYNIVTMTGELLDPLADKLFILLPLLVLLYQKQIILTPVLLILVRELYIVALRDIALEKNLIVLSSSMAGKLKAFFQMFGVGFFILTDELFSMVWQFQLDTNLPGYICLWLSIALAYYSAIDYTAKVVKKLNEIEQ